MTSFRARLHDLANVGHHALDGRVGRRHQRLDVGGGDPLVAQLDRRRRSRSGRSPAPPEAMALAVLGLTADIAAVPGVDPRPGR